MAVNKIKRKKIPVFIIIVVVLITALLLVTIKTAREYFERQWLLSTHPLEYTEIAEKYALEYEIDKYLIYAVIKTESNFDESAVSNLGARGLMQIMDYTFEWIRDFRFFDDEIVFDDMFKPDENIRYGSHLLAYHLKFYGDIDCALAAYHAGDGNVDEWLLDERYSADGKTLDSIPISDTAHYVNKVNKAYETYIMLYNS